MDLWASFIGSPEARAASVTALVTLLMQFIKPYLPTGSDSDNPAIPTENRWVPIIHVGLTVGLNIAGAAYMHQDIAQSAFLGLVGALTAVGAMRGMKLATEGDKTERQRAAAVVKAENLERKAVKLEGALETQQVASTIAIAAVAQAATEVAIERAVSVTPVPSGD